VAASINEITLPRNAPRLPWPSFRSKRASAVTKRHDPFDGDAGVDDQRVHRTRRPSRSNISDGVCFRPRVSLRKSAAKVSNDGSTSAARA
jgi:hypothetical protein